MEAAVAMLWTQSVRVMHNRGAATQRPLFLAAPGVANAQSAYFSFSQFLQWSDQPIYVLDKDNDLNIAQLARQNASDIVKVQPEGPYLLGGHSYGGAVAMEVAMVLESWGHEIGAVLVRPLPSLLPPSTCTSSCCCWLTMQRTQASLLYVSWWVQSTETALYAWCTLYTCTLMVQHDHQCVKVPCAVVPLRPVTPLQCYCKRTMYLICIWSELGKCSTHCTFKHRLQWYLEQKDMFRSCQQLTAIKC